MVYGIIIGVILTLIIELITIKGIMKFIFPEPQPPSEEELKFMMEQSAQKEQENKTDVIGYKT
ncbi:MAG: hypothetical protein ACOC1K_01135 [Nanoarchaeota archaeon]